MHYLVVHMFVSSLNRFVTFCFTVCLQGLHVCSPAAAAAAESSEPAINPLQQAPAPLAARSFLDSPSSDKEETLRARAILRNIAISPRKLNMFAKVVRRLGLEDALIQCEISCKKSAQILRNVIKSAKANAVNNHGLDGDKLVIGRCGLPAYRFASTEVAGPNAH